jgi:hypothetical protein
MGRASLQSFCWHLEASRGRGVKFDDNQIAPHGKMYRPGLRIMHSRFGPADDGLGSGGRTEVSRLMSRALRCEDDRGGSLVLTYTLAELETYSDETGKPVVRTIALCGAGRQTSLFSYGIWLANWL